MGRWILHVVLPATLLLSCAGSKSRHEPDPTQVPEPPKPSLGVSWDAQPRPQPDAEPEAPREPVEGYTPDVERLLGLRWVRYISQESVPGIAIERRGPVRFGRTGPRYGLADHGSLWPIRMMVAEDTPLPRVVTTDSRVRLLIFVERGDAHPVIVDHAPLREAADARVASPPKRGFVMLHPGALVEVLGSRGDAVEISYDEGLAKWSGWVDARAVGTTSTWTERQLPDGLQGLVTKRGTALRETPRGKTLHALEAQVDVQPLSRKVFKGHRLVEYRQMCETDFSYVGFVAAKDLEVPRFGGMGGCGTGSRGNKPQWGDVETARRVTIPAGRFLLDPDSSSVVGCVIKDAEMAQLADNRYAYPTPWGPLPVRLAPEDFEGPCGTK